MSRFLEFVNADEVDMNSSALYGDIEECFQEEGDYSKWPDGMEVTMEEQFGGGEGGGETVYCVYKVVDNGETKYYKAHGWYASYDGSHYDGIVEVTPYQEMVTKWK